MSTPGSGDPYFYEWYVGLSKIIEMLNPDSEITSVTFQHSIYDTVDDVVVEYRSGKKQFCYQIKHEKLTSKATNLTFSKLIEKDNSKSSKASLIASIFSGWEYAVTSSGVEIIPILYTNRMAGSRRASRTFSGEKYSAYSIHDFFSKLKDELSNITYYKNIKFSDNNLNLQWKELYASIKTTDIEKAVSFVKALKIKTNQPDLINLEKELIVKLEKSFSCNTGVATELFGKLVFALRRWTTTLWLNKPVLIEDAYQALVTEEEICEAQHRLAPPTPFFESRKQFCSDFIEAINNSDKKVFFVSGEPGSGKTSIMSYLQASNNLFYLRYHTFRPISPEQHFYNLDVGQCSAENLWGTLLIQIRKKLKGHLFEYNVPVNNKYLTIEQIREHVLRLLGVISNQVKKGERIYICIDGIDHAARANNTVTFLSTLPMPIEIPDGVCFVIVGQPIELYREQYPIWLSEEQNIKKIFIPKLSIEDVIPLISEKAEGLRENALDVATLLFQYTQGNNLSTVFAIEEIKRLSCVEEAARVISKRSITSDIQQYYNHIWNYVKNEIRRLGVPGIAPETLVACPILLLNGQVNVRIMANALTCSLTESDWRTIFNSLFPLIYETETSGVYALFHNDFRVFLMSRISNYTEKYQDIAFDLANYYLNNDEGIDSYVNAIPLLQCAQKTNIIPSFFTPKYVINSLAEGISKQRLDEFTKISYTESCKNKDIQGYINTYLSIKTLYQHIRYYEFYEKTYISKDYPELELLDIAEMRSLPISKETLFDFESVLTLCEKLYFSKDQRHKERAISLYKRWFDKLMPYSFLPLIDTSEEQNKPWRYKSENVVEFLEHWGKTAVKLRQGLNRISTPEDIWQNRVLSSFGEAYFTESVKSKSFDLALHSIEQGYVNRNCFMEQIESIYYSEHKKDFEGCIRSLSPSDLNLNAYLLSIVILIQLDENINNVDIKIPDFKTITTLHDWNSFEIVLRAFILGFCERNLDDAVICSHSKELFEHITDKFSFTIPQISSLVKFACLLGKYYHNNHANESNGLKKYKTWFFTTELSRPFDYLKSIQFLEFTFLNSPAGESFSDEENTYKELSHYLFNIGGFCSYHKTTILEYLKKHNQIKLINDYIQKLYGDNFNYINQLDNKQEIHEVFSKYGEIVEPEIMTDFSDKLKWDVVGYVSHKEYALYEANYYFEKLIDYSPKQAFSYSKLLYSLSQIANKIGNRCSDDIRLNIQKAAIKNGLPAFWNLRYLDMDFRLDPYMIYNSIFEFTDTSSNSDELTILWLLNCGIHSWYTQEDRIGATNIYKHMAKHSAKYLIDFRNIVSSVTPQWLAIIDHKSVDSHIESPTNAYTDARKEAVKKIESNYSKMDINTLIGSILDFPALEYSKERYRIVLRRLNWGNKLSCDYAFIILDSFCKFLSDNVHEIEYCEDIISAVYNVIPEQTFWSIAAIIGKDLSKYNYQTSNRTISLLLRVFAGKDREKLSLLFESEMNTQELWISCNNHISTKFNYEEYIEKYEQPDNFLETSIYMLLDQIKSLNARKIESALYALYLFGQLYSETINIITKCWSVLSEIQKEYVLLVIYRWVFNKNKKETELIYNFLEQENLCCNSLSRKLIVHSILHNINPQKYNSEEIRFDFDSENYSLPKYGYYDENSIYESYISLLDNFGVSPKLSNGLRKMAYKTKRSLRSYKEPYIENDVDVIIPQINIFMEKLLYNVEKKENFDYIPLIKKKSFLLLKEDPFVVTDIPRFIFNEKIISENADNMDKHSISNSNNKTQFSKIMSIDLPKNRKVIAGCMWYPWNHEEGAVYYETAKLFSNRATVSKDIEWSLGNYGLLNNEGDITEEFSAFLESGGMSLFKRVGGYLRIYYGNSQMIPSVLWREVLNCSPSCKTPYIWVNEKGEEVLWFERIASPMREAMREHYIRQPIIFRWVCNSEWIKQKLQELGLKMIVISKIEKML